MNKIFLSLSILLACIISASAQNTVSFDNQSGEPALVKLIGTTTNEIEVPDGTKQAVQASAGKYFIKVRYGVEGKYHYTKGQEFTVDETATTTSAITITLHKVVNGNYESSPISEREFGEGKPPQPTQMEQPPAVLPKIEFRQMFNEYGVKRLWLKVIFPAQSSQSASDKTYELVEGEQDGPIKVLEISKDKIKLDYSGTEMEDDLDSSADFHAVTNAQSGKDPRVAKLVTKPSAVNIEYVWDSRITNSLSANQIAGYKVLFKAAVENAGMKVVQSTETPTVKISMALARGFGIDTEGKKFSSVAYNLTFLCVDLDGHQIFRAVYGGSVKNWDSEVKLDDVEQAITKKLQTEPLSLR